MLPNILLRYKPRKRKRTCVPMLRLIAADPYEVLFYLLCDTLNGVIWSCSFMKMSCMLFFAFVHWLMWLLLPLICRGFDLWPAFVLIFLDSLFWRFKTISISILRPFCNGIWSLSSKCWSYGCPLGYTWSFDQHPPTSRIGWKRILRGPW